MDFAADRTATVPNGPGSATRKGAVEAAEALPLTRALAGKEATADQTAANRALGATAARGPAVEGMAEEGELGAIARQETQRLLNRDSVVSAVADQTVGPAAAAARAAWTLFPPPNRQQKRSSWVVAPLPEPVNLLLQTTFPRLNALRGTARSGVSFLLSALRLFDREVVAVAAEGPMKGMLERPVVVSGVREGTSMVLVGAPVHRDVLAILLAKKARTVRPAEPVEASSLPTSTWRSKGPATSTCREERAVKAATEGTVPAGIITALALAAVDLEAVAGVAGVPTARPAARSCGASQQWTSRP